MRSIMGILGSKTTTRLRDVDRIEDDGTVRLVCGHTFRLQMEHYESWRHTKAWYCSQCPRLSREEYERGER
jgi:hypothetical protein